MLPDWCTIDVMMHFVRYFYYSRTVFQQQQLIELIRNKDRESALSFAQIYLSEHGDNPARRHATEKTLTLFCFDDLDMCPAAADLLPPSRRTKVSPPRVHVKHTSSSSVVFKPQYLSLFWIRKQVLCVYKR